DLNFCLPVVRLVHPNIVEANYHTAAAGGMVTRLDLAAPAEIVLALEGLLASIDGVSNPDGHYQLSAGTHLLCAFAWPLYNHSKERSLRLVEPPAGLRLQNPVEPDHENPWVLLKLSDFALVEDDVTWIWFKGLDGKRDANSAGYRTAITTYLAEPQRLWTENQIEKMLPAAAEMFVTDTHWCFIGREVLGDAADLVQNPQAVMFDNPALTTVLPCGDADVELIYDLGEETVGYFDLELMAPAGVALDVYAVEYIAPDGRVQHTGDNRNGLRYITRAGLNRFTSLKRRAGRYLFLTLRYPPAGDGAVAPVHFRLVRVIESTYPAEPRASFACSDARLERIWQISARTLELCMEDTFTDCPLYEQTYWVGDARNESIFAYDTFGAVDIARRCLRLAAQSLERYPLVGGQVPSSWDMLLPAWSFLWGIAVWDSYFYTGDRAVLDEFWPAVVRNLQGAEALLTDQGLFGGPFWNMFDWSGIDDQHETVLHNSLLLVGALRAAEKCATVLNDGSRAAWLSGMRERISRALNSWWNPVLASYPDSLLEDGSPSPSTCQHTSFLALLYDVIPTEYRAAALANTLTPPVSMVKVGSPFAMMYLYEAMEKAGQPQSILDSIYENYLPMLRAGASTVWEVFPASNARPQDFPTRSHCHAWSSAPLHFLPAVVLGIRQTAPGCAAYDLSPWLADGLDWAEGSVCTPNGMLQVSWKRTREHLQVQFSAPESAQVHFERNASMEGLEIEVKHLIPGN
ncbi:MAG: hypothetical protein HY835_02880, partial [Anaerolineae bacterium]|nr:hypothetical protein [Anaerolineae bacterium]